MAIPHLGAVYIISRHLATAAATAAAPPSAATRHDRRDGSKATTGRYLSDNKITDRIN